MTEAAEIREIFSHNLTLLCAREKNTVAAARAIGISRTMLNRFLSGQSWPRPDKLELICDHFGVDANILLVPLDQLPARAAGTLLNSEPLQPLLAFEPGAGKVLRHLAGEGAL